MPKYTPYLQPRPPFLSNQYASLSIERTESSTPNTPRIADSTLAETLDETLFTGHRSPLHSSSDDSDPSLHLSDVRSPTPEPARFRIRLASPGYQSFTFEEVEPTDYTLPPSPSPGDIHLALPSSPPAPNQLLAPLPLQLTSLPTPPETPASKLSEVGTDLTGAQRGLGSHSGAKSPLLASRGNAARS